MSEPNWKVKILNVIWAELDLPAYWPARRIAEIAAESYFYAGGGLVPRDAVKVEVWHVGSIVTFEVNWGLIFTAQLLGTPKDPT
jgi:hypothetical protein